MRQRRARNDRRRWDDLAEKSKQDKAFGINPAATSAQAGDPLCSACGTGDGKRPRGRPVRVGVEKHIRITDTQTANRIDALIARGSNFNKVVNDALFYGLPILYEKTVGGVTEVEQRELTGEGQTGTAEDAFYATLMRLLKEIVLNVTINKSILSSLYHAAGAGLMGVKLKENFQSGLLSDTPEYLERYEAEGIKNLRR